MTDVLRESGETAARERMRLEARAGRTRTAALLSRMPALARRLGTEEAAQSGLRYQPVAWTLIVVAAVALYFPGRDSDGDAAPAAVTTPSFAVTSPTTVPPVLPPSAPPRPSATPVPVAVPPATSSGGSSTAAPAPTTTVPAVVALSVRGFGWASSLSGTGLGAADVPEGTMPVATRLGQVDKVSFVRLSGTATTLSLAEDVDGAREAVGAGAVVICPVTDAAWAEEPDQSLEDAPAWDADACVAGTEDADTWTFDLAGFADRSGDRGFALVPDATAPPDFQVTFRAG